MLHALLDGMLAGLARATSAVAPWYRWPFFLALATTLGHRVNLRRNNLHDTQTRPPPQLISGSPDEAREQRTADGSYNDLAVPWMGMANARFARNMPLVDTFGERPPGLFDPSPRLVSNALLARRSFVPAPHLNVLAAAWIQFMVHDWLSHGPNDSSMKPHEVPLPANDDWEGRMEVLPTVPDTVAPEDEGRPAAFTNVETSWWDGSQIYGSWRGRQHLVRTDPQTGKLLENGKLALQPSGLLPLEHKTSHDKDIPNLELAGVNGNWWIGLSVCHTLFVREHNAIVDRLRCEYPGRNGEWLFQKARLVNAALLAKIHTVEWTPALMNSPEGRMAMRGNFWGLLGEHYSRANGRLGRGEILSGIPGSPADHHGAPYAMTEEFAAVYRFHSLLPDAFSFRRHADDREVMTADLKEVQAGRVHDIYEKVAFEDVVYSLATSNPGALVLHNFPNALRLLERKVPNGMKLDLATVDILRDRERGVPRYCAFRRRINADVPASFEELTANTEWQEELRAVYGEMERVDLMVGMLAESAASNGSPAGFGFSDTAFRIFILMASRRLKSDRFFTDDYRPEVYTPAGFAWVQDNSLRTVLARHCPELELHFADVRNVFFPWAKGA